MMNKKYGFWYYNWLVLLIACLLFWVCYHYWSTLYQYSPLLILLHVFLLYLFILKFIFINIKQCDHLLEEMRVSGWSFFKVLLHPFACIYRKCAAGIDLITQRMGAEQELAIAEKKKKMLELKLSQRELYEQLTQYSAISEKELEERTRNKYCVQDEIPEQNNAPCLKQAVIPPYAKYGKALLNYLDEVNWEHFSITQAQMVLHKRFGTTKLVLEELVEEGHLAYVEVGKRMAYTRLKNDINNK